MREINHTVWLGVWLIFVPFLGISSVWKERLVILTGVAVLAASSIRSKRNRAVPAPPREVVTDTYRENAEKPVTADKDHPQSA